MFMYVSTYIYIYIYIDIGTDIDIDIYIYIYIDICDTEDTADANAVGGGLVHVGGERKTVEPKNAQDFFIYT